MEHLSSFTLGTGFGLLIAFLTGFLKQAGADFYSGGFKDEVQRLIN